MAVSAITKRLTEVYQRALANRDKELEDRKALQQTAAAMVENLLDISRETAAIPGLAPRLERLRQGLETSTDSETFKKITDWA